MDLNSNIYFIEILIFQGNRAYININSIKNPKTNDKFINGTFKDWFSESSVTWANWVNDILTKKSQN